MRVSSVRKDCVFLLIALLSACVIQERLAQAQEALAPAPLKPVEIKVPNGAFKFRVLVQSPAETNTELQIVCLFESVPANTLHGSLVEANEKLAGLLDKIRQPSLFRGQLGETVLIVRPRGSLATRSLLIIGLGDSQTFTPQRLELIGSIVYNESNRLRAAHPFFAPTILDGGVSKFATGEVAEEFVTGFLRAARIDSALGSAALSKGRQIEDLTFLAGPTHARDTQRGIERALAASGK